MKVAQQGFSPLLFGFLFFSFSNSIIAKHLTVYYIAVTEFIVGNNKPQKFTGKNMLPLILNFFWCHSEMYLTST